MQYYDAWKTREPDGDEGEPQCEGRCPVGDECSEQCAEDHGISDDRADYAEECAHEARREAESLENWPVAS